MGRLLWTYAHRNKTSNTLSSTGGKQKPGKSRTWNLHHRSCEWKWRYIHWFAWGFPNFNERLSNNRQKETATNIETNSSIQCSQVHFKWEWYSYTIVILSYTIVIVQVSIKIPWYILWRLYVSLKIKCLKNYKILQKNLSFAPVVRLAIFLFKTEKLTDSHLKVFANSNPQIISNIWFLFYL